MKKDVRKIIERLLKEVESNEWQTHHAAENTYCPYCNEDSWSDQTVHNKGCAYVKLVSDTKAILAKYPQESQ